MGNTSTRYVAAPIAAEIFGGSDNLNALKSKLEIIVGKHVDFRIFHDVILRKFEKIVSSLDSQCRDPSTLLTLFLVTTSLYSQNTCVRACSEHLQAT